MLLLASKPNPLTLGFGLVGDRADCISFATAFFCLRRQPGGLRRPTFCANRKWGKNGKGARPLSTPYPRGVLPTPTNARKEYSRGVLAKSVPVRLPLVALRRRKVRLPPFPPWRRKLRPLPCSSFPQRHRCAGCRRGPRLGRSLARPFPSGTAYPQGVRRIRKAAKPPTAAQSLGATGGPVLRSVAFAVVMSTFRQCCVTTAGTNRQTLFQRDAGKQQPETPVGAQCRDSYFLEESRLSEQFLGENDGQKWNERAGVHQGARPLGPLFPLFLAGQKWGPRRETEPLATLAKGMLPPAAYFLFWQKVCKVSSPAAPLRRILMEAPPLTILFLKSPQSANRVVLFRVKILYDGISSCEYTIILRRYHHEHR